MFIRSLKWRSRLEIYTLESCNTFASWENCLRNCCFNNSRTSESPRLAFLFKISSLDVSLHDSLMVTEQIQNVFSSRLSHLPSFLGIHTTDVHGGSWRSFLPVRNLFQLFSFRWILIRVVLQGHFPRSLHIFPW